MSESEVTRFHTAARKIPMLIGKVSGTRLWGGPYTITQVIAAVIIFIVSMVARPTWSRGGLLVDFPLAAGVTVATVIVAGKIPPTRRGLFGLAGGVSKAISAPGQGSYKGKPLRSRPAHRVSVRCVTVILPEIYVEPPSVPLPDDSLPDQELAGVLAELQANEPSPRRALSAVEKLLAEKR